MKLQVALDLLTIEDALELAGKVAEHVDIIELGTPLIKAEGLSAVTAIKEAHPTKIVFADMKTMDAGELEADIAFKAGADLVSVLGTGTIHHCRCSQGGTIPQQGHCGGPDRRCRQGFPRQGSPRLGCKVHRVPRWP